MNRLKVLAAAALLSAAAAHAENAGIDLDQGADIGAVLSEAKEKAESLRLEEKDFGAAFSRWERDCAVISIGAEDPETSERVHLESRFYEERCYPAGRHGERTCHEEWTRTERRSVRVRVAGRGEMLPWERDVFRVCLDGHWLGADVVDASHNYSVHEPGWNDDTVVATAQGKTRSLPDPAGVYAESLRVDPAAKNYVLNLRDRWASYYAGEQTVISLQLKRHRSLWFDDTLVEKEFVLAPSDAYAFSFADYASEFSQKLKEDADYYVRWRFKRAGNVSKDSWQGWWETGKVRYHSSAALLAVSPAFDQSSLFEAKGRGVCTFRTVEKDQCVYRCRDGSTYRQPVREPDPWDRDGTTIPCPQIVIPF